MHPSSYLKMQALRDVYLAPGGDRVRILDVGSRVIEQDDSYKGLFPEASYSYTGLDVEAGTNVDVVVANPYRWDELASESFDVVISGQVLEHNPYFWITLAEIARVLVPGGLVCLIAPSTGDVHRYPLDCWRFYPDSAAASPPTRPPAAGPAPGSPY